MLKFIIKYEVDEQKYYQVIHADSLQDAYYYASGYINGVILRIDEVQE